VWPPAGHYYSPIPDLDEVRRRQSELFERIPETVPGIDLRADAQLALLPDFAKLHAQMPFGDQPRDGLRYGFRNGVFEHGDGTVLYSMLRTLRPSRYLEIGSGWSSALALDVRDRFLAGHLECTLIEPFPQRLHTVLKPGDRQTIRLITAPLQDSVDEVKSIGPGDVLFIDSTHVAKIGSDVLLLINDVLPSLPAGVHVHVHDIFYPFEYPAEWLFEGRAWNEAYLLRAYLAFNPRIRITWFSSYLARFHVEAVENALPTWAVNHGGSIWLETV
jgi:hypothetical protein